ncbi:HAD family hydrolase [Bacillus testis]|uniref:HAD family hydrolase n=1 Tax=Bacillus testis TaxID=1622072 RepID=UPI00067ECB0F|nr:HAD family hydrolase [Bacillus testis]
MLKAVLFDLDDTLLWDQKSVSEAFKATCSYAAAKYDISSSALEETVRKEARKLYASYDTYEFTQMIGINPFEGLWGDFGDGHLEFPKMKELAPGYRRDAWTHGLLALGIEDEELGRELAERFPAERKKNPYLYEESLRVLEALKGKYKLVLLTNGSPELQKTKLSITPEIAPYFDEIIISGDFGKGKPDSSIFEYALEQIGVGKDEALMVGDNLMTDILGSNRAGIRNVWVNRHRKERTEVEPTYEIKHLEELYPLLERM